MAHDPTDESVLLGPVDLKSRFLGAAPHALGLDDDEITLTMLPGRNRLWIIVLPTVLIAWNLQPYLPDPLPPTLSYILLVLAAFYVGDRWSEHVTRRSFDEITHEQAAKDPDHRIPRSELQRATTDETPFGGTHLVLETSTDSWTIAIQDEDLEHLAPLLEAHPV